MSQNIHDTNTSLIKEQVSLMIDELREIVWRGESPSDFEYSLSKKYKHLATASPTLFSFVLKNGSEADELQRHKFRENLDMMLKAIEKIQNASMSQYDASAAVGTKLAQQYIPQLKKE
jgi:hypothetical protein